MDSFSLEVQNLSKHYGTNHVFSRVTFTHTKDVLGIAGPNGSGKSTLLQCLSGLKRPTAGHIAWKKEKEAIKPESLKKQIGFAAPYISLYDELTCAENLDFLLKLQGTKNRIEPVNEALQKTGLARFSTKPYGNLSTGQQQRLKLAAAIIHEPAILFLDEPGANLDEEGRHLIEKIVENARESEKMVLIASNSPAELELCDRLYSVEKEDFQ